MFGYLCATLSSTYLAQTQLNRLFCIENIGNKHLATRLPAIANIRWTLQARYRLPNVTYRLKRKIFN